MQRAELRKVARMEDKGRLALVPRTTRECHRLLTLPGSLSREDQVRSRDITSRGAVHQFAMQCARLRPFPPMPEDSRQAGEGDRVAPRHTYGSLERGDRLFETSSRSQRDTECPARHKRLGVLLNGPPGRLDRLV